MTTARVGLIVGHSLKDQGAVNKHSKVTEFAFNSEIVMGIAERLAKLGLTPVVMYRTTYRQLPHDVNTAGVDIAVSFHCNAFNERATGTEVLHLEGADKSKHLAECIQKELLVALGLPNRGVKAIKSHDRGGNLLYKTAMPCVIAEPFFIDNDQDLKLALTNKEKLIDAYVTGIYTAVS